MTCSKSKPKKESKSLPVNGLTVYRRFVRANLEQVKARQAMEDYLTLTYGMNWNKDATNLMDSLCVVSSTSIMYPGNIAQISKEEFDAFVKVLVK